MGTRKDIFVEYKINRRKKKLLKSVPIGTSFSDANPCIGYLDVCRLAVQYDDIFKIFKRAKEYRKVLEHVTEAQGKAYLDAIEAHGQKLLQYFSKFKKNDKLGGPYTFSYKVGRLSPTTLRYIKVLMDLKNYFGNLNDYHIVEIGAGYAGQCKIISDVFDVKSYFIIDLPVTVALIQKYLTRLDVKNVICTTQGKIKERKYDLIISNYAFSECKKSVQDYYIEKVIYNSHRGYITYNHDGDSSPILPYNKKEIIQLLSKKHTVSIIDESPKTGRNNFVIVWGNIK